ncbi:uncharacterized protein J4E79_010643 [Alternaria viburni]|uniref:uncharacterized protein n=1 Tax=Alternaria viburni TaxID=566460 RepID=UPI0020C28CBD|nr:uncharacterized protein J4E79_010643 [Alternaria viburni]KAI4646134.1 hypothetical protein J4E79_010643 [Alternaria viburni]
MAMSKYENIIWEEKIKEQILSHARILYSQKLNPNSILDVVNTTSKLPGYSFVAYTSHVVDIDAPKNTGWRVLLSSRECMSLGECLEETLQTLQDLLRPRLQPFARPAYTENNNLARRSIKQQRRVESNRSADAFLAALADEVQENSASKKRRRY